MRLLLDFRIDFQIAFYQLTASALSNEPVCIYDALGNILQR